jgi:protein SCO1/2
VKAGVTNAELDTVSVDAGPRAALPLSLPFTDDTGTKITLGDALSNKPALLIFADYTCNNLCGPILSFAVAGLEQSGLISGKDFRLVVIGLDPKDGVAGARAMKAAQIGGHGLLADVTLFLTGTKNTVRTATDAAGYHYVYDAEHDQFAHPAAAFVLTKDGHITRVLSGLGLTGSDLRLALVDAGEGRVGSLLDQIRLRCFGFDAAHGIYTASVTRMLAIAGAVTVIILFGGILVMTFGKRRRILP